MVWDDIVAEELMDACADWVQVDHKSVAYADSDCSCYFADLVGLDN